MLSQTAVPGLLDSGGAGAQGEQRHALSAADALKFTLAAPKPTSSIKAEHLFKQAVTKADIRDIVYQLLDLWDEDDGTIRESMRIERTGGRLPSKRAAWLRKGLKGFYSDQQLSRWQREHRGRRLSRDSVGSPPAPSACEVLVTGIPENDDNDEQIRTILDERKLDRLTIEAARAINAEAGERIRGAQAEPRTRDKRDDGELPQGWSDISAAVHFVRGLNLKHLVVPALLPITAEDCEQVSRFFAELARKLPSTHRNGAER